MVKGNHNLISYSPFFITIMEIRQWTETDVYTSILTHKFWYSNV
jgi:hypothetical protein